MGFVRREKETQMADNDWPAYLDRAKELEATGMTKSRALNTAILEDRIARWPQEWGDELQILIYGDFLPPPSGLSFPELGITIESDVIKNSFIKTAMCVVKARVTVLEKSIKGIVEASGRIDRLLGLLAAIEWGNSGNGWWCRLTHGMGGARTQFDPGVLDKAVKVLNKFDLRIRYKVASALYWMRQPRRMAMESYSNDILGRYAGYWNAFECLVDAVCIVRPQQRKDKQEQIDKFLADHGGKLTPADVIDLNRIVDPGFRDKASYALRQWIPDKSAQYIHECFEAKPDKERLYQIRNEINHGDFDASNLEELIRIEDKWFRLWMIVFRMLGQFIPIPTPVDAGS
jgi:hypothetical protein